MIIAGYHINSKALKVPVILDLGACNWKTSSVSLCLKYRTVISMLILIVSLVFKNFISQVQRPLKLTMHFFATDYLLMWVLVVDPFVDVHVRSEGCEDPGIKPNTCGTAYIKVDGKDHSLHSRGHNVVILDATTGV